jgi:ribonuclease E
LRLRDLAGLIVIDFIDMDERRNNAAVEKRLKDKLKTDRARIQVGRISGFGLLEMSRQRLRPGMLEATTQPCPHCHGTGLLRSDDNVALSILRQLEEEGVRGRSKEVLVRAPVGIANFLMNQKREHIAAIEARYGMAVRIECDVTLVSPDFAIEKFKTATRIVPEAAPITASTIVIEEDEDDLVVEDEADEAEEAEAAPAASGENGDKPKKRRRRRRRRRGGNGSAEGQDGADQGDEGEEGVSDEAEETEAPVEAAAEEAPAVGAEAPAKPKSTRSRSRKPKAEAAPVEEAAAEAEAAPETPVEETAPAKPKATRSRKAPAKKAAEPEVKAEEAPAAEAATEEAPAKPKATRSRKAPAKKAAEADAPAEAPAEAPAAETAPKPKAEAKAEPAPEAPADPSKPKRKGWWSLGR